MAPHYSFKSQHSRMDRWTREHKARGVRIDSLQPGQRVILPDGVRATFRWLSDKREFMFLIESPVFGSRTMPYDANQGWVLVLPLGWKPREGSR